MKYKIILNEDRDVFSTAGITSRKLLDNDGQIVDGGSNDYVTQALTLTGGYIRGTKRCRVCFYGVDDAMVQLIDMSSGDMFPVPVGTSYIRVGVNYATPPFGYPNLWAYREMRPLYGDDVSIEYEKESGQQFFRKSISGEFTFLRDDYELIMQRGFDATNVITILSSDDDFVTFEEYSQGVFSRTDCTINETEKTLKTKLSTHDEYVDILAGLDNEYDLVKLPVPKRNVIMSRRPMLQIYTMGESVINCFYDRHSFEVDCESIEDHSTLNDFHFTRNPNISSVRITRCDVDSRIVGNYSGTIKQSATNPDYYTGTYLQDAGIGRILVELLWLSTGWWCKYSVDNGEAIIDFVEYQDVNNGSTFEFGLYARVSFVFTKIYTRYVCDVLSFASKETYPITANDPVADNHNYTRCIGAGDISISASRVFSATPNEYGIAPNGEYYMPPSIRGIYYPISRTFWASNSLWFQQSEETRRFDKEARGSLVQRDFVTLGGAIKALLEEIAPNITHEETPLYSQFLYGGDPISGQSVNLLITPKSNVIAGEYQTPAMKATIRLSDILTMLRNTYQLYWYIDDGRLRIEHITYFENGGSYVSTRQLGVDLTTLSSKNRLPWAYGMDEYNFEKSNMPERYEFSWMDDVTTAFKGEAIKVTSNYVEKGRKEDVNIPNFTSDVDYVLLNGQSISQDGFVVIDADNANGIKNPDNPYSGGSTGTAVLYPIKEVNKAFVGTTATLTFLPSTTSSETAYLHIAYMRGEDVISQSSQRIPVTGEETSVIVNIPEGCDGITYVATTPSVRVKTYGLMSSNIKQTKFVEITGGGIDYTMQNGTLSMMYLQPIYWVYNMPARQLTINGSPTRAVSVSRNKTSDATFPAHDDPDPLKLIRTNIGDGIVDKMSINLSSRTARITVKYEIE